jgi:hypothetical protein
VPFGLQGASSLLMLVMNQALTVGLDFPGGPPTTPGTTAAAAVTPRSAAGAGPGAAPTHSGLCRTPPRASVPLGRCALVYMHDCLVHSPTLEQHLLDVEEVLEVFRRRGGRQLFAKSSKCEFGRRELGFLGHHLSKEGVSVDSRGKVQTRTRPSSSAAAAGRRGTGRARAGTQSTVRDQLRL